jgi:hypothetical protein
MAVLAPFGLAGYVRTLDWVNPIKVSEKLVVVTFVNRQTMGAQVTNLAEVTVTPSIGAVPEKIDRFIKEGLRRGMAIDCFDYIPSNARVFYAVLGNMQRGRLCEWGSGIGIGIGVAEMLGFEATGIEIDPALASAAGKLLTDFGLTAMVETGSYFDLYHHADLYFNYSWPSQRRRVEQHFLSVAPADAQLLICNSAQDIQCKVKL